MSFTATIHKKSPQISSYILNKVLFDHSVAFSTIGSHPNVATHAYSGWTCDLGLGPACRIPAKAHPVTHARHILAIPHGAQKMIKEAAKNAVPETIKICVSELEPCQAGDDDDSSEEESTRKKKKKQKTFEPVPEEQLLEPRNPKERTTDSTDLGSHNRIFRVASIDADNSVLFQNSSCSDEIKLPVPIKWPLDDQAAFDLIASQKFRDILPGPRFTLPVGGDVLLAFKRIAAQMPRATTAHGQRSMDGVPE
ncbi:hypothetical protein B0H14DRAFT_3484442 [Mycena olivaceomarginata]|nr:hypothetical protein B0H14DRAFT_3484442 [Mycena olivaceomarginata]